MCSPLDGERAGSILSPEGVNRLSGTLGSRCRERSQHHCRLLAIDLAAQRAAQQLSPGHLVGTPGMDVTSTARQHLADIKNDDTVGSVPGEPDELRLRHTSATTEAGADGWGHSPILGPDGTLPRRRIHSRHPASPVGSHSRHGLDGCTTHNT